jgi:hypothetical protein
LLYSSPYRAWAEMNQGILKLYGKGRSFGAYVLVFCPRR